VENKSERTLSLLVREDEKDQRIDIFLASQVEDLTRSRVQEIIRQKLVEVNGAPVKASYRLRRGDRIDLTIPAARPCTLEPEPVEFSILYEDASLLVIDKPPGVVIHPAPGHASGTLVHGLLQHCRDLSGIGGIMRPGIVHRLDKDTSGLLVVAKNDRVHNSLSLQFKAGTVQKQYLAIAHGTFQKGEGKIDLPIARHPIRRKEMSVSSSGGKKAVTFWEKIEDLGDRFTLLAVRPRTGRTHQIRVHLSHTGHPIVGDPVYGFKKGWWRRQFAGAEGLIPEIPRQMLHAERLGFAHPETGVFSEFHAPLPADMKRCIEELKKLEAGG
jgi:23S rRNA pseudouridine1911/1915/1917 synthase